VKPEKAQAVIGALKSGGIRAAVIGEVTDSQHGRWLKVNEKLQPLAKPSVDPYWKAYWKARRDGWE